MSIMAQGAIRQSGSGAGALRRLGVIGMISFLTLVDLFAAQAILPSLAQSYGVGAAAMGFAVNASTMGMAVSGLLVALLSRRIDRRQGIWASLLLLSVPTLLLSFTQDLTIFTVLRIAQGVFMASAFTLTMAYLAERCSAAEAAGALAAYITGNVASNLFGRLLSAALADHLGLAGNFQVFATLNLAGAVLVYFTLGPALPTTADHAVAQSPFAAWRQHLSSSALRASFAIGFLILFVFIGTFTYVNFVLAGAPIALSPMSLGLVYLVFLPSILITPLAGVLARRFGPRAPFWAALAIAGTGLPLLVVPLLAPVLAGLALVAVGTFLAQACATGFVSRAATGDRGSASGLYLASYYLGGLAGSAALGQVFDRFGWPACVAMLGLALAIAALLAVRLMAPGAALPPPTRPAAAPAAAPAECTG